MKNCSRLYARSDVLNQKTPHVFSNKQIEKSYDAISDCFRHGLKD